jgi:hypothetical protein
MNNTWKVKGQGRARSCSPKRPREQRFFIVFPSNNQKYRSPKEPTPAQQNHVCACHVLRSNGTCERRSRPPPTWQYLEVGPQPLVDFTRQQRQLPKSATNSVNALWRRNKSEKQDLGLFDALLQQHLQRTPRRAFARGAAPECTVLSRHPSCRPSRVARGVHILHQAHDETRKPKSRSTSCDSERDTQEGWAAAGGARLYGALSGGAAAQYRVHQEHVALCDVGRQLLVHQLLRNHAVAQPSSKPMHPSAAHSDSGHSEQSVVW